MERLAIENEKWTKFMNVINMVPTEKILKLVRLQKTDNVVAAEKLVEEETGKVLKTQGADKGV